MALEVPPVTPPTRLKAGFRLGPYDVLSELGAGGMGEVYRARDTKLGRHVAIKVLPMAFAADADRLARFESEARTLASLNHPNIAIIHGLEQAGDVCALVMELVEGEDLSEHIARGPIPLAEALPIAKQIADALDAAHEKGIVHRDLKPGNVMVRSDGTVKVLDFGLAKIEPGTSSATDPANSPTVTLQRTREGGILGTAAYMAPEQARGKRVDKRADIWAFGAVFYEMLTGRCAFGGEDVSSIIAAVIQSEPQWDGVPAQARRLIESCLEKDPRKRLRDIGDAWKLLGAIPEPGLALLAYGAERLDKLRLATKFIARHRQPPGRFGPAPCFDFRRVSTEADRSGHAPDDRFWHVTSAQSQLGGAPRACSASSPVSRGTACSEDKAYDQPCQTLALQSTAFRER